MSKGNTNSKKKPRLSNKEKLELMKRYLKSIEGTNKKFTSNTIFEGYNIGALRSNLRESYWKGTLKIDKDLLEEFKKYGIITEKPTRIRSTQEDKYNFLISLIGVPEEERQKAKMPSGMTYRDVRNYMQILYNSGKLSLSPEQITVLKQNKILNLAPHETESLGKGYKFPKGHTKKILDEYGSIEDFIQKYKKRECNYDFKNDIFVGARCVTVSEKDITQRQKLRYYELCSKVFFSGEAYEGNETDFGNIYINLDELEKALKTLKDIEQEVLRNHFGLDDGKPITDRKIGKEKGYSHDNIYKIEKKAINKIRMYEEKHKSIISKGDNIHEIEKLDNEIQKKEKDIYDIEELLIYYNENGYNPNLSNEQNGIVFSDELLNYDRGDLKRILEEYYKDLGTFVSEKEKIKQRKEKEKEFRDVFEQAWTEYLNDEDLFDPDYIIKGRKIKETKRTDDIQKKTSISVLPISFMSLVYLHHAGINTIEDLVSKAKSIEDFEIFINSIKGINKEDKKIIIDYIEKNKEYLSRKMLIGEKNISDLNISEKTKSQLRLMGINTLYELIGGRTTKELERIRGFGPGKSKEIIDAVHQLGYEFKDELGIEEIRQSGIDIEVIENKDELNININSKSSLQLDQLNLLRELIDKLWEKSQEDKTIRVSYDTPDSLVEMGDLKDNYDELIAAIEAESYIIIDEYARREIKPEEYEEYVKNLEAYNKKEKLKYDMHIHTTGSDGRESPLRLLYRAHRMGLRTISITDHDSVNGYYTLQKQLEYFVSLAKTIQNDSNKTEEVKEKNIKGVKRLLKVISEMNIVPGCEVITCYKGSPYIEILAYGVDYKKLDEELKEIQKRKKSAGKVLCEELKEKAKQFGFEADLFYMENRGDFRKLFFHEIKRYAETNEVNRSLIEGIEGETEEEQAHIFANKYLLNKERMLEIVAEMKEENPKFEFDTDVLSTENIGDLSKTFFYEIKRHAKTNEVNRSLIEGIDGETEEEQVRNFVDKYILEKNRMLGIVDKLKKEYLGLEFDREIVRYGGDEDSLFAANQFYTEVKKHPNDLKKLEEKLNLSDEEKRNTKMSNQKKFFYYGLYNPKSGFFVDLSKSKPSPDEAIEAIHRAGGKAFIAHWERYKSSNKELFDCDTEEGRKNFIELLRKCDGAELIYSTHSEKFKRYAYRVCKMLNKKISIGGDSHGKESEHSKEKGKGLGYFEAKPYILGAQEARNIKGFKWIKDFVINGREILAQFEKEYQYRARLEAIIAEYEEKKKKSQSKNKPEEVQNVQGV